MSWAKRWAVRYIPSSHIHLLILYKWHLGPWKTWQEDPPAWWRAWGLGSRVPISANTIRDLFMQAHEAQLFLLPVLKVKISLLIMRSSFSILATETVISRLWWRLIGHPPCKIYSNQGAQNCQAFPLCCRPTIWSTAEQESRKILNHLLELVMA